MRLCPRCEHNVKEMQTVLRDKEKKRWLVTFCNKCHFNFDIEEYLEKTTNEEEMEKYKFPDPPMYKPFTGFH